MKILVINLLRLGDLIMTTPTLVGLKQKYHSCEVHLLLNQSFSNIEPLLPAVDQFWHFDRELLQQQLADPEASLMEPFQRLKTLVNEINATNFDLIINLTHNRLSGYLMSLFSAKEKWGLIIDSSEFLIQGSPWFGYLNNEFSSTAPSLFHYADILYWACQLPDSTRRVTLRETPRGKREAFELLQDSKPYIVVQPFSNEDKKNWQGLKLALQIFGQNHSEYSIYLLGAPQERQKILGLSEILNQNRNCATYYPAIVSLEGALSLIHKAQLLVTMDTSIKHLASTTDVPILEIALGSSNYTQTGSYSPNALILHPLLDCAPCPHSKPCPLPSFRCGELIDPAEVAKIIEQLVQKQDRRKIAISPQSPVRVLATHLPLQPGGFWYASPQPDPNPVTTLMELIHKTARSFSFNAKASLRESQKQLALWQFGSLNHALATTPKFLENSKKLNLTFPAQGFLLATLIQALKKLDGRRPHSSGTLRALIDSLVSQWDSSTLARHQQRLKSWIDFRLDPSEASTQKLRDLLVQMSREIELEARLSMELLGASEAKSSMRPFEPQSEIKNPDPG